MNAQDRSQMLFSGQREHAAQADPLAHTHPLAQALRDTADASSAQHMRELLAGAR